jgi:hypothetical protein
MCRDHLASPTASANFKMLALKIALVICATCLDRYQSIQVALMLVAVAAITYYMLTSVSIKVEKHNKPLTTGFLAHQERENLKASCLGWAFMYGR